MVADPLPVGARVPDVTLTDAHGTPLHVRDLAGADGPALLVFLPYAFSPVCTGEIGALGSALDDLERAGVRVVAITCDPVPALRAWADAEGYPGELASDFWPHGEASRAFGVLDESRGVAGRGSFLLDAGRVVWSTSTAPGVARDVEDYRAAVRGLETG
ncbi:peroxiredoxin [Paraoerskovia sediminicola]|uniref:Peroxiredoxin n=1 Tax=Paraoerskovia sediminicola TaxID=1138587 RepID=A0ABM8G587_9CELL|nr:redoxin domain-containing protein [Paraoerskovia sediminicola]BDZ43263.1 peroxiredoxin [Paraoerskovia sediminicola]